MSKPTCAGPRLYRTFRSNRAVGRRGYEASAAATGGPEEAAVSKGPGGTTSGDGISALWSRQLPPLREAPGKVPLPSQRCRGNAVTRRRWATG